MVSRLLDGPVPGESLTLPPGATSYERPVQFADMHEALEYLFDKLTDPKSVARMVAIMKAGAPAEAVARTMLMGGFMQGKWTVDLALLLGPTLLRMIVAVAIRAGLSKEDIKVKNPDKEFQSFVKDFKEYLPVKDKNKQEQPTSDPVELMKGL